MKPQLSELEQQQMYFQSEKSIGEIGAGSPLTIWNDGERKIYLSDWSKPSKVRFMVVTLIDYQVSFESGSMTITGFEAMPGGRYLRRVVTLSTYKP